jgi:hypothetical protein
MASYIYIILFAIASLVAADGVSNHTSNDTMPVCWRETYCRGLGHIPTYCKEGYEHSGILCYPECKANYTGHGQICWENCPEGYEDAGAKCVIPPDSYYPCPWYDICGITTAKGCMKCKEGYKKARCKCEKPGKVIFKKSYNRGKGEAPGCKPNTTEEAGFCYPLCKEGWDGTGPVCWRNGSGNASYEVQCNFFSYGATQAACDELNHLLEKSGITSIICMGSLAASIITGHVVGPKICRKLIKEILPKLEHTKVCNDVVLDYSGFAPSDFEPIVFPMKE